MTSHPVAASAASGSLSSLAIWLARDLIRQSSDIPLAPFDFTCPVSDGDLAFWKGVLVGAALWPVFEALVVLKQFILLQLKHRLHKWTAGRHYKVL